MSPGNRSRLAGLGLIVLFPLAVVVGLAFYALMIVAGLFGMLGVKT